MGIQSLSFCFIKQIGIADTQHLRQNSQFNIHHIPLVGLNAYDYVFVHVITGKQQLMDMISLREALLSAKFGAGGIYGGAVAGDGEMLLWYEAAFHGRQDGCMVEELLQTLLKTPWLSSYISVLSCTFV